MLICPLGAIVLAEICRIEGLDLIHFVETNQANDSSCENHLDLKLGSDKVIVRTPFLSSDECSFELSEAICCW